MFNADDHLEAYRYDLPSAAQWQRFISLLVASPHHYNSLLGEAHNDRGGFAGFAARGAAICDTILFTANPWVRHRQPKPANRRFYLQRKEKDSPPLPSFNEHYAALMNGKE
jgi:hypothetical protein